MPAKKPNTDPTTPVKISILPSCHAMNEIVMAMSVPQKMLRKTWGLTFDNKTCIDYLTFMGRSWMVEFTFRAETLDFTSQLAESIPLPSPIRFELSIVTVEAFIRER